MLARTTCPLLLTFALTALVGCSDKEPTDVNVFVPPGAGGEPEGLVVSPPTLPSRANSETAVKLPNGGRVHTSIFDGKTYVPIEATFSERSWQAVLGAAHGKTRGERDKAVRAELEKVFSKISETTKLIGADYDPSIGLATAYVPIDAYASLIEVKGIGRRLLVNPITSTPLELAERDLKKDAELGFAASGAFEDLEGLVGLPRMGVPNFLTAAAADLDGYVPNGSHVLLGVVDTGITLNHPAFKDAAGQTRITSIMDFTGEGRIYFHPASTLEISPAEGDAVKVKGSFYSAPDGDYNSAEPGAFEAFESETFLLPAELKALLLAPEHSGARVGVLEEKAIPGSDIDHNGKTDDRFYAIWVPGKTEAEDAVWVAFSGKGDFRQSPKLGDYNKTKATQSVWAEKIGFQIKHEPILDEKGAEVPVVTASIVGFDPGSHGSHVTGIAAARKIFANDPDNTKIRGVAPLAPITFGRICANSGGCFGTKAIAALSNAGARVINMSIGGIGPQNDGYGVQEAVIDRLSVQNGTVFVIAASNDGPGRQTVGSPSTARFGISVAATASQKIIQAQYKYPGSGKIPSTNPDAEDFLMYFSSRGPTAAGGMKPDIAAPGTWLSAVQLNGAPGGASGLDVMWGTSMASPAMAGAVTLLLDAATVWNEQNPTKPLATDARTIRRVLLASARPFDATTFDTKTKRTTQGQYTWVDQGFGMVNLERAWQLLKQERTTRGTSAVSLTDESKTDVPLDYQVRVLSKNPNGLAYDGSMTAPGAGDQPEAKFGRGIWVDAKVSTSNYDVQIARRLPSNVVDRPDVGDLAAQLLTTSDKFELETTIHGSHLPWVRAGVLNTPDCASQPAIERPTLTVVGEGAFDVPLNPTTGKGGSAAQSTSQLHVCVDRALTDQLPPGDHGAIITAYRVVGDKRESVPSFVVPVYMTVPHKTLAGPEGLKVASTVGSFGVGRHYIDVPKGTTIVKIDLDVPAPVQTGTSVTGCGGVSLEALEGGNTLGPPEFVKNPSDALAMSCDSAGRVAPPDWRKVSIVRTNPKPGIWDLHVFGLYGYVQSAYTLNVEFATVTSTKTAITGTPALNGSFDVTVADASYNLVLSEANSTFTLNGFEHEKMSAVQLNQTVRVENAAGKVARQYADDVATVTIATAKSPGNDIDLMVLECGDAQLTACAPKGASGGPNDVETFTFTPAAGKFYVAEVAGFAMAAGNPGAFALTETISVKAPEKGTLRVTQPSPKVFSYATSFDVTTSRLLGDPRHAGGGYLVIGRIDVKDEAGTTILRLPVQVN
jgi:hypothetical protein